MTFKSSLRTGNYDGKRNQQQYVSLDKVPFNVLAAGKKPEENAEQQESSAPKNAPAPTGMR